MANDDDDDFVQDWEELCRAQKYDFQSYVLVDHVALKLLKNYAKHLGLQGVWRKMKMNKRWCQALPRLTKLYKKLEHFSLRTVEAMWTVKTFKSRKVVFSIEAKFHQEAKDNERLFFVKNVVYSC
jgi:hypothetical protein